MFQRLMIEKFLKTLEKTAYGSLRVVTPDGKARDFSGDRPGAAANCVIHDWRAVRALASRADIGFVEAYCEGFWTTDDLPALMLFGLQNEEPLERYIYQGFLARLSSRLSYALRENTRRGSKENIHAHYDLGNDFYRLWLDPSMTYSSALFREPNETLEEAQRNKYDRILDRCGSSSGRVMEIGCGWGGFAERALNRGDYDFTGITISEEQLAYARWRLGDRAKILKKDYRDQDGRYDHVVSIEMFEAVGEKFWPLYFQKTKSLLREGGSAVIQTITIAEEYFDFYRKSGDILRTFIFPGGMLATLSRFKEEAERAGLRITDRHSFGDSYVRTLTQWLENFEAKLPQIREMGFDARFIRIWRSYLAGCIASFTMGRMNVSQLELRHG